MKKSLTLIIANLIFLNFVFSQGVNKDTYIIGRDTVSIGPPGDYGGYPEGTTKGVSIQRMTTIQRNALYSTAEGLVIFNTNINCLEYFSNSFWHPLECPDPCGDNITIIDLRDNRIYKIVGVGAQCWFQENLNATNYLNGDMIPYVTDNTAWINLASGAYCNYNNDVNNANVYGGLYNWYAAHDIRKLCPKGWHVPKNSEWQTLSDYLGGNSLAGGKMKEAGTVHWNSPNTGAASESGFGFKDLPSGIRVGTYGSFTDMGIGNYFWTTTEFNILSAIALGLSYNTATLNESDNFTKTSGFSIRCLKD